MESTQQHYVLGLPDMDEQHNHLYQVFSLLEDAPRVIDTNRTRRILEEIERYILFHFASEELLMRRYGFPGFTEHEGDHGTIEGKLVEYLDSFEAGDLNPGRMRAFLSAWLDEHSRIADSVYAAWVIDKRRTIESGS